MLQLGPTSVAVAYNGHNMTLVSSSDLVALVFNVLRAHLLDVELI